MFSSVSKTQIAWPDPAPALFPKPQLAHHSLSVLALGLKKRLLSFGSNTSPCLPFIEKHQNFSKSTSKAIQKPRPFHFRVRYKLCAARNEVIACHMKSQPQIYINMPIPLRIAKRPWGTWALGCNTLPSDALGAVCTRQCCLIQVRDDDTSTSQQSSNMILLPRTWAEKIFKHSLKAMVKC